MLYLEEQYQQQMVVRKEQMKLFQQQYGAEKSSQADSQSKLTLPVKADKHMNEFVNPNF